MRSTRRQFLFTASGAVLTYSVANAREYQNQSADIVILGATTGGVAAALAACKAGVKKVILTEETDWLGGQLTSQLVPPDEHKWIESDGATKSYRDYRTAVRTEYRTRKLQPMREDFRATTNLNPGNGWVSRLCHEPRVGQQILVNLLAPFVATGQLQILLQVVPTAATVENDRITSVTCRELTDGKSFTLTGQYFLDATDEGDLLPLAKIEFVSGSESKKQTGEPNAADTARPGNIQSFTWCFMLEHDANGEHVIEKPKEYDFWKSFPKADKPLFQWTDPAFSFYPLANRDPRNDKPNFWTYRRVVDAKLFAPDAYVGDVSVINWHQNDYTLGGLHSNPPEVADAHRARAKQMSLSLLYWLQTDCPRSDGKAGWPGLKLVPTQTGTPDGLAKAPYIRESRRIKADFTVLEQHVSRPIRERDHGGAKATAEPFADSVGVGHYLYMDLHQTCEGEKKGGWPVFPFQIPLGALIPVRVTNLLAACKNLGVTHLTNGCYRLHPIEWNIGEAAGALAAFCVLKKSEPKQVRAKQSLLGDYQKMLIDQGFRLSWPASAIHG